MKNNYPVRINKQHKRPKSTYTDYIETSNQIPFINATDKISNSVKQEMKGSIRNMRNEFKKTTKRLLEQYADKQRVVINYDAKTPHVRLITSRATR